MTDDFMRALTAEEERIRAFRRRSAWANLIVVGALAVLFTAFVFAT